jgi:7-cyano-7-deazaguanine synthase
MQNTNSSFLVLFSGGFDSYVTTEYIIQKFQPSRVKLLNIHYSQVNEVELYAARRIFNHLRQKYPDKKLDFQKFIIPKSLIEQLFNTSALVNKEIEQKDFEKDKQPTTYVPFRNLLFFTIASIIAENENYNYIGSGIQPHTEYYYWDAGDDFIYRLNSLLNLHPRHMQIIAPFKDKTKEAILKIAREELKLTDEELSLTWSCYNPILTNIDVDNERDKIENLVFETCGKCGACIERQNANIPDSQPIQLPYDKEKHLKLILTYLLSKKY